MVYINYMYKLFVIFIFWEGRWSTNVPLSKRQPVASMFSMCGNDQLITSGIPVDNH